MLHLYLHSTVVPATVKPRVPLRLRRLGWDPMLQMLFLNALLKPRVPILLRWLGESLMLPPRVLPIVNAAAALLLAAAA